MTDGSRGKENEVDALKERNAQLIETIEAAVDLAMLIETKLKPVPGSELGEALETFRSKLGELGDKEQQTEEFSGG